MIRLLCVILIEIFSIHSVKSRSIELCVRAHRYMPRLNGQHKSKDRPHYGNEYGNSCLQKDNSRYSRAWRINGVRVARFFQRVYHYSSSFSPSEFKHFSILSLSPGTTMSTVHIQFFVDPSRKTQIPFSTVEFLQMIAHKDVKDKPVHIIYNKKYLSHHAHCYFDPYASLTCSRGIQRTQ